MATVDLGDGNDQLDSSASNCLPNLTTADSVTNAQGKTTVSFAPASGGLTNPTTLDFYHRQFVTEIANWSDAEKAEWNAHIDEIVADLAAEGITVETEEIAPGVYDIVWTDDVEVAIDDVEREELDA